MQLTVHQNSVLDIFIWKPTINGNFTTSSWEDNRVKSNIYEWITWVWHKMLSKKFSLYMWKALFNYLPVDNKIWQLGIPLVSSCNYCIDRKEETITTFKRK